MPETWLHRARRIGRLSSRRLPLAGLAALLLVVGVDHVVSAPGHPLWSALEEPSHTWPALPRGLVAGQRARHDLAEAGRAAPTVLVLGNSRGGAGFRRILAERVDDRWTYTQISHAAIGLPEMLTAAYVTRADDVDAGVLFLSDFELYRPQTLRSDAGLCAWRAVADVAELLGPTRWLEQRQRFLRLGVACSLGTYRLRPALQTAGLDTLRHFDPSVVARRPGAPPRRRVRGPDLSFFDDVAVDPQAIQSLFDEVATTLQHVPRGGLRRQARHALAIGDGPHVAFNQALIRRTVEAFTSHGARVLIVEPPVHPALARRNDPALRRGFLRFAESLEESFGERVELLPLEESGPFDADAFSDLTHLDRETGAPRLTKAIASRLARWPLPDDVANDVANDAADDTADDAAP